MSWASGARAVSVALLAAFVHRQLRVRNPILPLRLVASTSVTVANLVQALMSSAFFGFFFLGSLDLERVLRYSPMQIGLAFLPVAVVMALFSVRFSAALIQRFGPRAILTAGQAIAVVALGALAVGPRNAVYPVHMLVPLALLGLGGGLAFPALTIIAMSGVRPEDAGLGSGLLNTTGQVGGALGLAALAVVAGVLGFHFAWLVCAGLVAVTLPLVVGVLGPRRGMAALERAEVESEAAA